MIATLRSLASLAAHVSLHAAIVVSLVAPGAQARVLAGEGRARELSPGVADVAPLAGEPEVRWSFGPLAFEGEPLAEGGRVVVTGRDATGRRALVVLDEPTGRVLSRTLFAAKAPLAAALSGERVAVRGAEDRVDLYRLRGARLLPERSFVHPGSASAPRLDGEELLLREGDEIVRHDLARREPAWRVRLPGQARGAPAARGARVFAAWSDAQGGAHLVAIERESGRLLGDVVLGRPRESGTPERDAFELVVLETAVFVRVPAGLPSTSGQALEWARVPCDGPRLAGPTLHDLLAPPLETLDGWVAPARGRDGTTRWLLALRVSGADEGTAERSIELASSEHHAWLCASTAAASRARDVLYLGPCAADARTRQVLWRRAQAPAFRPVPVPDGLLVIEGSLLVRLGTPARPPEPAQEGARELAAERERALGERLAQLASKALRAGDGELAHRLVDEAEALGASGRTLELLRANTERAAAEGTAPARAAERRAALLDEERATRAVLLRELCDAARVARDASERHALLAQIFRRDPAYEPGLAELARILPRGAELSSGTALSWLELLELDAHRPIELVTAVPDGSAATRAEKRLAEERASWRADAIGYQSERLLVVTAGAAPGAVARTLRAGELVCDVLEETFGGARGAAERLELVLYPTREEYLAHSDSDLGGLESVLGFTAGHFDLASRTSRLFLPPEDADGARLLGVSAHELTHHWLATRSSFGPPRSAPETGGFWVVEAIATWVEELRLDPERETWTTAPARAASLDTVANADARDLLPWRALLTLSFADYCALETRPTCTVSLDWQLGARASRSPMQLFYAQGAAVAHYLLEADGGERRALLLRAVEAYYRGAPLDVAAELGLAPEELGARVAAWSAGLDGS